MGALLVSALVLGGLAGAAEPDLPELLKGLARNDAELEQVMKSTDFTRTELQTELDGSGKTLHQASRTIRFTHPAQKEQQELLGAKEDGHDATGELRPHFNDAQQSYQAAEKAKKKKDVERWLPLQNPFAANEQGKYRFLVLGAVDPVSGQVKIHFEPRLEASSALYVGDAFVDATRAALVSLSYVPAKLPIMVQRMATTVTFQQTPRGPALKELDSRYDSGVLFAKKHIHAHSTFEGF